jgi:quinol monooxygenase YgiN
MKALRCESSRRTAPVMDHVAWLIELTVRAGSIEALRALTEDMVDSASLEPGVVVYERFISHDHTVVHLYERYADSDAALAHLRNFTATYAEPFLALVDRTRVTVYGTPTV